MDPWGLETIGIKMGTISNPYFYNDNRVDILVLGNVQEMETGIYCNMRNIATVCGAGIGWGQYDDGRSFANFDFYKGVDSYRIRMDFDNVCAGEYASDVRVLKNNFQVTAGDPVFDMLQSQNAQFFLEQGEYGDSSLRVQAKMSTMFWLCEQDAKYEYFWAAYEISEDICDMFPWTDRQQVLDMISQNPLLSVNFDAVDALINPSGIPTSWKDLATDILIQNYGGTINEPIFY